MLKWGGITFAVGLALVIIETVMASRKKGGITPTDRQRIWGIFWVSCVMAGLVAGLIWMSD
ncbi:MAG: hypothetical protein A3G27_05135 [Betaproteobacteria bacterium RIFCSPLOWO2_12_FULL_66_14]|nr:MAG: hypothetical protein A3G27_05135 [Betaproteobacteria bacterium RIFCSPLOWO2_12_FULL_66_14]